MPGSQNFFAINEPHLSAKAKARNPLYTKKREPYSSRQVLSFFAE